MAIKSQLCGCGALYPCSGLIVLGSGVIVKEWELRIEKTRERNKAVLYPLIKINDITWVDEL